MSIPPLSEICRAPCIIIMSADIILERRSRLKTSTYNFNFTIPPYLKDGHFIYRFPHNNSTLLGLKQNLRGLPSSEFYINLQILVKQQGPLNSID